MLTTLVYFIIAFVWFVFSYTQSYPKSPDFQTTFGRAIAWPIMTLILLAKALVWIVVGIWKGIVS